MQKCSVLMRETAANNPLKIQTSSVFPVLHPCRSQIHSAEKYHESPFKVKRSSAPTAVLPERKQTVFRHSLALMQAEIAIPAFPSFLGGRHSRAGGNPVPQS
jgi:hypothetical protein